MGNNKQQQAPEVDDWVQIKPKARAPQTEEVDDWQPISVPEKAPAAATAASPLPQPDFSKGITWDGPDKASGPLDAIKRAFTKDPGSDAKAMFKTLGYAGGLTADALQEVAKRIGSLGKEGLGAEEWRNALKGDSTPVPDSLQKNFGLSKPMSYAVGLPAAVITDPFAGAIGPMSELKPTTSAWNLLSQQRPADLVPGSNKLGALEKTADALVNPIASGLQEAGRRIYRGPFKKVDSFLREKYPGMQEYGNHPFTDLLWNGGNPEIGGFTKENMSIADQIRDLRKERGQQIGDITKQASGTDTYDLAPTLPMEAKVAQMEEAVAKQQEALAAGQEFKEGPPQPPLEWLKSKLSASATAPGAREGRQQAVELLTRSVPDLKEPIEQAAKALANSKERPLALQFLHGLIDDLAEGPRSLEDLKGLGGSMAAYADGSLPMQNSTYQRLPRKNLEKEVEAMGASSIGDIVTDIIADKLPDSNYRGIKKDYHILRKSEVPAARIAAQAAGRPLLSGFNIFGSGVAAHEAASGNPFLALAMGPLKFAHETTRSPRLGTGTGMLLNNLGSTNLWDNMLRRRALDAGRTE